MARPIRTFWKGNLRLSLVVIPVRLVTATRSDGQIAFHQVHRDTKQRIRYLKTAPGVGEVDKEDIVHGYEAEPGQYVLLEDEEIDALKLETRHTVELTEFVDACEIDPLYFDRPYYIVPDGEVAEEAYRVLRDAMREEGKVAIGQLTLRGKENLVALKPSGAGMLLETLRYETEIKDADDVFAGIGSSQLRGDLVDMAKELIAKRSTTFDPTKFKNHYAEALRELVQIKLKGGKAVEVAEEGPKAPGTVVDFMEALKRSVAAGKGKKAARPVERHRRKAG